jgi:arthrofactin-type cyclic lipopeptide synthetase B
MPLDENSSARHSNKLKRGKALQRDVNYNTGHDRNPGFNANTNATSADKLLERMLLGADEPAAPFGLVRGERRAAKSADLKLERDLTSRLSDRAATLNIGMESLVCLAWSLVLVRFSGRDSVTFGAALPPFTKVVPLRIDTATRAAETAVRETYELLTRIRAFLPVWGALLAEDPGAAYSLPAMFGYGLPEDHVWIGALSGGTWPLAVIATEQNETLLISAWAQNPAEPATVCAYMRTALERLAGTLETAPNAPVASIDVMPDEERRKLLIEWNATDTAYPREKCIHHLVEEQAARTPSAVAVVDDGRTLTYSQLNAQANQLAHHLLDLGVGPDALVAICVERSLEMVVGLIAILKAGGAYVPMDPSYPQERLVYMLEDSAPVAVLTHAKAQFARLGAVDVPVIDLEADAERWAGQLDSNPDLTNLELTSRHTAYVIYTSGSTGQPKGVVISHSALCNHMNWMQAQFSFSQWTRVLQKTPMSFDASVWEFYAPLIAGGQLVLAPPNAHREPAELVRIIAETQVTVVQFVPTLLRALLNEPGFAACGSLVDVFCGGEALPPELVSLFLPVLPRICTICMDRPKRQLMPPGGRVNGAPISTIFPLAVRLPTRGPMCSTIVAF